MKAATVISNTPAGTWKYNSHDTDVRDPALRGYFSEAFLRLDMNGPESLGSKRIDLTSFHKSDCMG